jgi:hypothetical protein
VSYESVYPGVDLVYYGAQGGELEYDFVVAPGADPKAIALGIETRGQAPLRINSAGDLIVQLQNGQVLLHKPVVYQTEPAGLSSSTVSSPSAHHTTKVEGHYALDANNHVGFKLGPYDHNRALVIDPVLVYATYVGGSGGDIGFAIAVNSTLEAYIAGVTNSSNFPIAGTSYQSTKKGNSNCFVTEMNSSGTGLVYSTYIGGSESDTATALALGAGNTIFITGYTDSADFPTKAPSGVGITFPFQQIYGGNTDAFVTQLSSLGNALAFSTYLGGSGLDQGQGIAVDSAGNAYVTGATQSTNFPVTTNALQSVINGSQNAFVTKVNSTGEALIYSTYLGGSEADTAQAIQLDSAENMYIAGYTFSGNFPTAAPIQRTIGGAADAFVAELNAAGSALTFSTFLGGTGNDEAYGLALDGSNNIYITGWTVSSNFPTTSGAFQPELKGPSNAFVTKLNAGGTSLAYSTYLGGSGIDQGTAIAVIPSGTNAGAAFVTGFTESSNFPTQNPVQAILGLSNNTFCGTNPCPDAFITQLNAAGSALTYSTYLGGNGYDSGQAIALDYTGDPYITGSTISTNFPATAPYNSTSVSPAPPSYTPPYKSTLTGTAGNAFVAKIDPVNSATISIQPGNLNFGNETISVTSALQQITLVNPSTAPLTITNIQITPVGTSNTVFVLTEPSQGGCLGTLAPNGATCQFGVSFTPNGVGSVSTTLTITDNAGAVPGTEQTITLTGAGVTAATSVTVQPSSLSFTSQNVGTISAPQTVTITNTGTETLTITEFSVGSSLDFSVTTSQTGSSVPSCTSVVNTLAVNQSCSVYVYFTPTASGTRTGTLSISDNAAGSPQTVALTGIGAAAFTLSSPTAVNPTLIGSTQTTFVIEANGPTSFNGAISLACSAGSTCAFSTNPIFVRGTSTLTISNLTSSTTNPYPFTVTGTSGSQTFTLQLNLEFADYNLTITPSSDIIQAGSTAGYTILVNPLFGFGLPNTPSSPTSAPVTGGVSPAQVQLSISTSKYTPPVTHAPPRFPGGKLPPLIFGLLSLAALASLAFGNRRRARRGWLASGWLGIRVAALSLILVLDLALVACRAATLATSGTTTGNYTVQIQGALASNTAVVRYASTNLSITLAPTP